MRLYFAAMYGVYYACADETGRPRLLTSFWDHKHKAYDMTALRDVYRTKGFLDSGAFSAANSGATIDLEEFAAFYLEHRELFEVVSSLDVIGDPRGSERNLHTLRKKGVPALAVWHMTSSLDELDRVAAENEHFAIGGMVPYVRKERLRNAVLERAWERIYKVWPRKVHAFGVTESSVLLGFPWHSVDSSAAIMSAAYGTVYEFNHSEQRIVRMDARRASARYGEVMGRRVPMIQMRCKLNICAMMALQHHVTATWRAKGVEWDE